MVEHYFTEKPDTPHREKLISAFLRGRDYSFWTDASVFSRDRVDRGTRLLIEAIEVPRDGIILDLGCGYGPIGIVAAVLAPLGRVYMVDLNERAVALARRNVAQNGIINAVVAQGEGYEPVSHIQFDAILTNPPIRAGKSTLLSLISGAVSRLVDGGSFWLVARTKQGVLTLASHMRDIFGNVEEREKGGGFRVMRSLKA